VGRCAVIYNPTKVDALLRERIEEALEQHGYQGTLWLETSAEDAGKSMTRRAVAEEVDLVIGAGGDGTIRMIADGLAGTGIPLGLVPAGTGNLLARNLNLPLDEVAALAIALGGQTRKVDLVKLQVDDAEPEHFAVIAGIGVDAMIMGETDPALKEKIGPAAYFLAAGRALGRLPVKLSIRVDDQRVIRRNAMSCLIGNVGELPGSIVLIPQAKADDGLLDVYVASPQKISHWFKVILRVISRRPQKDDRVDELQGRKVTVAIREGKDNYQLDGDAVGECTRLEAEIQPGALTIRLPEEQ
jgi:diacylglycerol kinase (ATP)